MKNHKKTLINDTNCHYCTTKQTDEEPKLSFFNDEKHNEFASKLLNIFRNRDEFNATQANNFKKKRSIGCDQCDITCLKCHSDDCYCHSNFELVHMWENENNIRGLYQTNKRNSECGIRV